MKPISFLIYFLSFTALSYAQQYQITASLTGFENGTKFYLKDLNADKDIDSAILKDGKFTMTKKVWEARSYWLYTRYQKKHYYTNLLIGGEKVQVTGDIKDFPRDLKVSGSVHQDAANKLNLQTKQLWKQRDTVVQLIMPFLMEKQNDSTKKIVTKLGNRMNAIDSVIDGITLKFIAENLDSFAAMQEIFWKRTKYKREEFERLYNNLKPEFKKSSYGDKLEKFIKVGEILKKGDAYHNFTAEDVNGKKYELSNYTGKYLLIDFTETYCAPCILSAVDLKNVASRYATQLQVISFYAETNKSVMLEGIKRDQFSWPNIWDGKGSDSEITLNTVFQDIRLS